MSSPERACVATAARLVRDRAARRPHRRRTRPPAKAACFRRSESAARKDDDEIPWRRRGHDDDDVSASARRADHNEPPPPKHSIKTMPPRCANTAPIRSSRTNSITLNEDAAAVLSNIQTSVALIAAGGQPDCTSPSSGTINSRTQSLNRQWIGRIRAARGPARGTRGGGSGRCRSMSKYPAKAHCSSSTAKACATTIRIGSSASRPRYSSAVIYSQLGAIDEAQLELIASLFSDSSGAKPVTPQPFFQSPQLEPRRRHRRSTRPSSYGRSAEAFRSLCATATAARSRRRSAVEATARRGRQER